MINPLPTSFRLGPLTVYTFGVFISIGFFISLFIVWQEGKKDGFDEEKIFDLFLLSGASAVVFSKIFFALSRHVVISKIIAYMVKNWSQGFNIFGLSAGALLVLVLVPRAWKWSVFRILDIFSLAWALGLSVIVLGFVALQNEFGFLFVFAAWLLFYAILNRYRNRYLKSGYIFSIFLALNVVVGMTFFRQPEYLIFYLVLVTLSLATVVFRRRIVFNKVGGLNSQDAKNMAKNLPREFIEKAKNLLRKKEKQIEEDEKILEEGDPYMVEGRDVGNSEYADESMEDIGREIADIKRSSLTKVKTQVRKALASMNIGTYGICEVCGDPIDKARLEAYPEATKCVKCANLSDEKS